MSIFRDLASASSNLVSSFETFLEALPDRIEQSAREKLHEDILEFAALYKSIDEKWGQTRAPNWFYLEKAKAKLVADYKVPSAKEAEYRRFEAEFQKSYETLNNLIRSHRQNCGRN